MNGHPLVSVIIPNYCHSNYLDERIQSILNQSYGNFEVIILDDCSPDDGASKAVIEKYRPDPHVSHIVYNETNSGSTFKQWQKGFSLSRGEYIWIAESDDSCHKELLATLLEPLENNPNCVLSFCRSIKTDSQGLLFNVHESQCQDDKPFVMSGKEFINTHQRWCNFIVNASSAVFRKSAIEGMADDYTNMKGCGDWLFWIHLSEKGDVSYSPYSLNYFRFHALNTTSSLEIAGTSDREMMMVVNYLFDRGYYTKNELLRLKMGHYWGRQKTYPFKSKTDERLYMKEVLHLSQFDVWYYKLLVVAKSLGVALKKFSKLI